MKRKLRLCLVLLLSLTQYLTHAQTEQQKYIAVITERSDKILKPIGITDTVKYNLVRDVLVEQYQLLSDHHDARAEEIKTIKESFHGQKEKLDLERANYEKSEDVKLLAIHDSFIGKLNKLIDEEQIEQIKDGMTYGVLPLTYQAYQDMIPRLTKTQKEQIFTYLFEAREHAMDASGSKEKHGVFGKYKGRINNYLSKEGYNLKEEGEKWDARRAAKGS